MVKSSFKRSREENETQAAKTIAFVHHKGGTGKTTSCLNIAGWLAKMKKTVLVVDLDPQGNATAGLGVDRQSLDSSIYDVFFGQHNIKEVILETDSGVYLVPSSLDLLATETHMAGQINNTRILKANLSSAFFVMAPKGHAVTHSQHPTHFFVSMTTFPSSYFVIASYAQDSRHLGFAQF